MISIILAEIKEYLNSSDHIFNSFIKAANIEANEILRAFEDSIDGNKRTARNLIDSKVKENIERRFNQFYNQEKIDIQVEIEGKELKIFVLTGESAMNLSERSDGLRWYFSLFIDVLSRDLDESSVLYLFDEPGIHLHVNAQKELNFFLGA